MASIAPEPPRCSGKGVVRPVCASVCSRVGEISPLCSEARPWARSCSTARLRARLRISSCSSVGAKLGMRYILSIIMALAIPPPSQIGLQAIATAGALKFVQQHGRQARAGGSQRVTNGDCAAVDVDLRHFRAGLALPGQRYAGEGFVDLHQVDLVERQCRPCAAPSPWREWVRSA